MIIKTCKTCGPLVAEQIYKNGKCKTCAKKDAIIRHHKNKEARYAKQKLWVKANPGKVKEQRARWNKKNKAKKSLAEKVTHKKYYNKNKESINERTLKHAKQRIYALHDSYIKAKIKVKHKIPIDEIPQWMVDLKRDIIKLRRAMRAKNDS